MRFPILIRSCNILLLRRSLAGWRLSATVWAVFIGLAACGFRTSVTSAGHGLESSTTSLSMAQAVGGENIDGETTQRAFGVPELVLKDLASSDLESRLRALDHWDAKDTKVPLAPVFEAMEDEDEAVRARATAIIEQQWAMEQDVIELTFSTTKSIGGRLITRRP